MIVGLSERAREEEPRAGALVEDCGRVDASSDSGDAESGVELKALRVNRRRKTGEYRDRGNLT
ncbi:MAG: hypothetical protein HZA53_18105 [Planctomycetes bacterium]|nr:hypothetical protein [Planctomycetota bacterium]